MGLLRERQQRARADFAATDNDADALVMHRRRYHQRMARQEHRGKSGRIQEGRAAAVNWLP